MDWPGHSSGWSHTQKMREGLAPAIREAGVAGIDRPMKIVLLPGLDGTGRLFAPFIASMPPGYSALGLAYPPAECRSYDELSHHVAALLPQDEPYVIVAESFSGPIAIRLAANAPPNLLAIVLCASFVQAPGGAMIRTMIRRTGRWLFAIRPPRWTARFLLAGAGASEALVSAIVEAISSAAPSVLSHRLGLAMAVDDRQSLAASTVPILYLRATRDRLIGFRSGEQIRRCRADVAVVSIDGPHLLLQRRPAEAMNEIDSWLRMRGLVRRGI